MTVSAFHMGAYDRRMIRTQAIAEEASPQPLIPP
jgi:hypothetical protein